MNIVADIPTEMRSESVSFETFRRWALSDEFPETGRYDFIRGRLVVDVEPESLFSHNALKCEIAATLSDFLKDDDLLTTIGVRVTMPMCELSVQPDIAVTTSQSFKDGRVTLTPHPTRADDAIEIVGPPDLVVEIISDSSVTKDSQDLCRLYFDAGVREYWLIDARGEDISFRLLTRGEQGWEEVPVESQGFRASLILERSFRLDRQAGRRGEWRYDLLEAGHS
ncbi:MAG: Uma2 family endonuclease [Blastocatellia bacterium]|nr:Uma2 family endonuclease [Blastocatellia bacterium]